MTEARTELDHRPEPCQRRTGVLGRPEEVCEEGCDEKAGARRGRVPLPQRWG